MRQTTFHAARHGECPSGSSGDAWRAAHIRYYGDARADASAGTSEKTHSAAGEPKPGSRTCFTVDGAAQRVVADYA